MNYGQYYGRDIPDQKLVFDHLCHFVQSQDRETCRRIIVRILPAVVEIVRQNERLRAKGLGNPQIKQILRMAHRQNGRSGGAHNAGTSMYYIKKGVWPVAFVAVLIMLRLAWLVEFDRHRIWENLMYFVGMRGTTERTYNRLKLGLEYLANIRKARLELLDSLTAEGMKNKFEKFRFKEAGEADIQNKTQYTYQFYYDFRDTHNEKSLEFRSMCRENGLDLVVYYMEQQHAGRTSGLESKTAHGVMNDVVHIVKRCESKHNIPYDFKDYVYYLSNVADIDKKNIDKVKFIEVEGQSKFVAIVRDGDNVEQAYHVGGDNLDDLHKLDIYRPCGGHCWEFVEQKNISNQEAIDKYLRECVHNK